MNTIPLNLQLFKEKIDNFDDSDEWKYEGDKPAVIEFFATWCPHCKKMAPMVEDLARRYKGKIDFYTADIEKESELASLFNVEGTPTFIFIPMNGEMYETVGEHSEEYMIELIDKLL